MQVVLLICLHLRQSRNLTNTGKYCFSIKGFLEIGMDNISLFRGAENGNRYKQAEIRDFELKEMVQAQTTLPVFFN